MIPSRVILRPLPDARVTLYLVDGYALIYRAFFALIARPHPDRPDDNTFASLGVRNFLLPLFEARPPVQ